jgi:hypothetical protein
MSACIPEAMEGQMPELDAITETFCWRAEQSIGHSPFFRDWQRGRVDRAEAAKFLEAFDQLVQYFPKLIALGASRADDEATRGVLAENLFQECGSGDVRRTHHAIFRKFLATAGVAPLQSRPLSFSRSWQVGLTRSIEQAPNPMRAVSILAAGEFLAQPALSRIFDVLEPLFPGTDVEYFTTHLALETDHMREIAALISHQIECGGVFDEAVKGFDVGLHHWERYFNELDDYVFMAKYRAEAAYVFPLWMT